MVLRRIFLIAFWTILLLAGCASAPTSTTESKSTGTAKIRSLVYTLSGGITGKTNTWTIFEDGRISGDNSLSYRTMPLETSAIFSQIPLADFIEQSKIPQEKVCADCITATLQFHVGDQSYELSRVREKMDPGDPVRAWLEKIDALIAKATEK